MKITINKTDKLAFKADLVTLSVFKDENNSKNISRKNNNHSWSDKTINELDKKLCGQLIKETRKEGFLGNEGQVFITSTLGQTPFASIAIFGLGEKKEQNIDLFRRLAAESLKIAQKKQTNSLAVLLPEHLTIPLFDIITALTEGFYLANYRFDRYLTKEKKDQSLREIKIYITETPSKDHKLALERGEITAQAVLKARDLINEGPSELNPVKLAEIASDLAIKKGLYCDILDEKKLKKENMRLMLAVASASKPHAPPRLIKLHYKPEKASKQRVILIGKGVTFDSGGLDIKTADGMLDMKVDMSGAATVLGTLCALAELKPKVEVVGYMACVENGVGPEAYHPGDIIISRKGVSVEISNTDAEGRLVLADTITYATDNDKPTTIIDIATLTGACMIALGQKTAGLFSNNDALAYKLIDSGKTASEDFWRLPLNPTLKESLKSTVADIKNCGDRYGGAITAALFLSEFIEPGIEWAHLDIAGPATNNKPHPYLSNGGVGFGIRTLIDYVMGL